MRQAATERIARLGEVLEAHGIVTRQQLEQVVAPETTGKSLLGEAVVVAARIVPGRAVPCHAGVGHRTYTAYVGQGGPTSTAETAT